MKAAGGEIGPNCAQEALWSYRSSKKEKLPGCGALKRREKQASYPDKREILLEGGECRVPGRGTPRRKSEASWSRTGSGMREGSSLPARFRRWLGKTTGSAVSTAGVLPAERMKRAGRGRGVGREKEAHSPPEGRSKYIREGYAKHTLGAIVKQQDMLYNIH